MSKPRFGYFSQVMGSRSSAVQEGFETLDPALLCPSQLEKLYAPDSGAANN
jgi:hypothetical protein